MAIWQHLMLQSYNRSVIQRLKTRDDRLSVINLDDKFCDEVVCRMLNGKSVLYRDDDHLSLVGARYISSLLASSLNP